MTTKKEKKAAKNEAKANMKAAGGKLYAHHQNLGTAVLGSAVQRLDSAANMRRCLEPQHSVPNPPPLSF